MSSASCRCTATATFVNCSCADWYQSVVARSFISCAHPHYALDSPSCKLSDTLNRPIIDLRSVLDRSGKETLITERIHKPPDCLALLVNGRSSRRSRNIRHRLLWREGA